MTLMQKPGEQLKKKGGSPRKRSLREKKEIDKILMNLNIVKSDYYYYH